MLISKSTSTIARSLEIKNRKKFILFPAAAASAILVAERRWFGR